MFRTIGDGQASIRETNWAAGRPYPIAQKPAVPVGPSRRLTHPWASRPVPVLVTAVSAGS